MVIQRNKKDFTGIQLYLGIDVHKKDWKVAVCSKRIILKRFSCPPDAEGLVSFLQGAYPGASFASCYEAGFCGFWIHEKLAELGVSNIVVNAADVPTSHKEKDQKRDKLDARKLALCLRGGLLRGIYTPDERYLQDRTLLRNTKRLVKDMTRLKNRIKAQLAFLGIVLPKEYDNSNWSKGFKNWLGQLEFSYSSARRSLDIYLDQLSCLEDLLKSINVDIGNLAKSEYYRDKVGFIESIKGFGMISSMVILTELGPIQRFKTAEALRSYVGLIPSCDSSGDKTGNGKMTKRGNKYLRTTLIECSWRAVSSDPVLLSYYEDLRGRMSANKAIVRIARKLLNRIRAILLREEKYEPGRLQ